MFSVLCSCLVFCFFSIHNLLARSRSNSVDPDTMLDPSTVFSNQPLPPPHQRLPPPRHCLTEGGSHPRFTRSESAPPEPSQSLVVKLNQRRNAPEHGHAGVRTLERSRFPPNSPLPPPPPAPKSVCVCLTE